jgi:hypothetical protein
MLIRQKSFLAYSALILLLPGAAFAETVNWDGGNWNGGTGNGYNSGSASGTTTGGGVSVQWLLYGTADGTHSGLGGTQPRVLTSVGAGGAGNGVLTLATSGDRNPGGSLVNYATFTINFLSDVNLANGALTIQDVDNGSASTWQDFVAVRAFRNGIPVSVTYSILAAHQLQTMFGYQGVRGTSSVPNSGTGQANGDVGVNFGSSLDQIIIYYFQGPAVTSGTGADHGVWLKDISYTSAVPEPSTNVMLGIGGLLGLVFVKGKKRQQA